MPQQDIQITDPLDVGRQAVNAQTQELYADRTAGQRVYATDSEYGVTPGVGIDNRAALQLALDAAAGGTLVLPNGIIEFSGAPLDPPVAKARIEGQVANKWTDTWTEDIGQRTPGYTGTILQRMSGSTGAFFSAQSGLISLEGITFRQPAGRTSADGLFPPTVAASHLRICGCRFESLNHVVNSSTAFQAIHFSRNFIVDCEAPFSGNALGCTIEANTFTSCADHLIVSAGGQNIVTGNRFERSTRALTFSGGTFANIVEGNVIDRISEAPLKITGGVEVIFNANNCMRSGTQNVAVGKRSHIYIKDFTGKLTVTGNIFRHDVDDGGTETDVPKYLIEYENDNPGTVIWKGNSDVNGYTTNLFLPIGTLPKVRIFSDGFHISQSVGSANTDSDILNYLLADIGAVAVGDVNVYIYGPRKSALIYQTAYNVHLIGAAPVGSNATITNAVGSTLGVGSMHNVSYGGRTYTVRDGAQYVDLTTGYIEAFGLNSFWQRAKKIYYNAPANHQIGFIVMDEGAPQTFAPLNAYEPA